MAIDSIRGVLSFVKAVSTGSFAAALFTPWPRVPFRELAARQSPGRNPALIHAPGADEGISPA